MSLQGTNVIVTPGAEKYHEVSIKVVQNDCDTKGEAVSTKNGGGGSADLSSEGNGQVHVPISPDVENCAVQQVKCEPKDQAPKPSVQKLAGLFFTGLCMGLLFGAAMERGKVTPPITIRKQFLFQRFVMIKMFLSASAFGALCFSLLSVVVPTQFEPIRAKFMSSRAAKGLVPVVIGTFLLGCGMSIAGACPGMVYIQVGAGVENSIITLLGGMVGAVCYGFLQPFMTSFLAIGLSKSHKLDDFSPLKSTKYWQLGLVLAVMMVIPIALFEHYFPWDSPSELGAISTTYAPWSQAWSPLLSGVLIGSLQIPAVLVSAGTVGSSSTYMTVVAQLLVTPSLQTRFKHMDGFRSGAGMWQSVLYIWSAALGAYIASSAGGTFGSSRGVPPGPAFIGGFLMLFGSRSAAPPPLSLHPTTPKQSTLIS